MSEEMEPFLYFIKPLIKGEFRYMITGSIAAILYGEPRMTNDVDLVLYLPAEKTGKLTDSFPLDEFYCPPEEVLLIESGRLTGGHFNLIHHESGFKCDVYLANDDPLQIWGLSNAQSVSYEGVEIQLAPPEYVIVRKVEYFKAGGSRKHIRDIRAMLRISANTIDLEVIQDKLSELDLLEWWNQVCEER